MPLDNANKLYQKRKGKPHPDKVEGPVLLDRMGGEALQRPLCTPTVPLGTGGEPHPNLS